LFKTALYRIDFKICNVIYTIRINRYISKFGRQLKNIYEEKNM
jgi:hypothetical protein